MSQIALWWRAARPFAFTVSLIPPILGGLVAAVENPGLQFSLFSFILAGIGCMTAHGGANLLSDYYDFNTRINHCSGQARITLQTTSPFPATWLSPIRKRN